MVVSASEGTIRYMDFLHDRPCISSRLKSISNESDIIIHVTTSQLFRCCQVINNRLWRHQQNEYRGSETRGRCVKIVVLSSFMDTLCRVRNKIIYVLSSRTVSALTRGLFLCLLINTKITIEWALKQFVTRVHTLFSIKTTIPNHKKTQRSLNRLKAVQQWRCTVCNRYIWTYRLFDCVYYEGFLILSVRI